MRFTCARRTLLLVIGAPFVLALQSRPAHGWAIGSQLDNAGCHEPITAQALRTVRATLDTAPALTIADFERRARRIREPPAEVAATRMTIRFGAARLPFDLRGAFSQAGRSGRLWS